MAVVRIYAAAREPCSVARERQRDTTFEESAFTPKLGAIKPIDIFSLEHREIKEETVTDLMGALVRDGRFLQDIAVRDEGASGYRLIFGAHRLEAWKRHFGEQTPIPADIFPSDTSNTLIVISEIEENLVRKELTPAERDRQTILLAAATREWRKESPRRPASPSVGSGKG